MEQNFIIYVYQYFKNLIELYGFHIIKEFKDEQSYLIEYSSDDFVIKIEKYYREFYPTIYKIGKPNSEINFFNLLEYLKKGNVEIPVSNYFHKEKDIEECYKKQLAHISSVIIENLDLIFNFFNKDKYETNVLEFEKYWKSKHPELYKVSQ